MTRTAAEKRQYATRGPAFLEDHPECQGCRLIYKHTKGKRGWPFPRPSQQIHHMKGRLGRLYLDEKFWKALCADCHDYVEKNRDDAKKMELSFSRLAVDDG